MQRLGGWAEKAGGVDSKGKAGVVIRGALPCQVGEQTFSARQQTTLQKYIVCPRADALEDAWYDLKTPKTGIARVILWLVH